MINYEINKIKKKKMKKIKYLSILLTLLLISCYEDKGNYDYKYSDDIIIELEDKDVRPVVNSLDTIKINPKLNISNYDNYSYMWTIYNIKDELFDEDKGEEVGDHMDTISIKRNLNYKLYYKPGDYILHYHVADKITKYQKSIKINLTISTEFSLGWYFLKTENGMSELDYNLGDKKEENILKKLSGKSLMGEATNLTYLINKAYEGPDGVLLKNKDVLIPTSVDDAYMIQIDNLSIAKEYKDMFYGEIADGEKPIEYIYNNNCRVLLTTKGVYNEVSTGAGPGTSEFGERLVMLGGYPKLSKVFLSVPYTGVLYYDEDNFRFLMQGYNGGVLAFPDRDKDDKPTVVNSNNMNSAPIYIAKSLAIMDDFDNDNIYVYKLDQSAFRTASHNPIMQGDEINILDSSTYPFIHKAKIFSHSDTDASIYYADSDALHMYDILGNSEIPNIATFPGEEITFIKHIYMNDLNETDEDVNFDYIVVATYKDGKYKIYMYEIYLGRPDLTKEVKMFYGSGKIAGIHYVSPRHAHYSKYPY